MARRASRLARLGGGRPWSTWGQGNRTRRPARRSGAALCFAQATASAELRRAGISSGGLGVVSSLCPAAVRMDPEEVGAAKDDQRDPRRNLGGEQSGCGARGAAGEAGGRG